MPAKAKKPAAKKPAASSAKKAAPKAVKKTATKAPSSKPVSAKKAAPQAAKKPSPTPVKKAASKKAPAAKKAPAKKEAPAKKAPAAEKKPAVKATAPAKKATAEKKPAAAPEKKVAAAPAPAPVAEKTEKKPAAPAKTAKPAAEASKPAASGKSSAAEKKSVSTPTTRLPLGTPRSRVNRLEDEGITIEIAKGPVKMTPFLKKQKQRLVELRDAYLNSIEGVASGAIRNEHGDASAFGMHQADAGSDAYDRDFALSLLGKEQDALYEINEALKRIETGTYGVCEGTGTKIPEERLEAMPFARYSVSYQEKIERSQITGRWSRPVHSLFGLDNADDVADDDKDEDDAPSSNSGESLDFSKD